MRERLKKWIVKNTMRIAILLASVIVFVVVNNIVKDKKTIDCYEINPDSYIQRSRSYIPSDTIKDSIK